MAEPGEGGEVEPAPEALLLMAGGDGEGDAEELVEVVDLEPPGPGKGKESDWGGTLGTKGLTQGTRLGIWAFLVRN